MAAESAVARHLASKWRKAMAISAWRKPSAAIMAYRRRLRNKWPGMAISLRKLARWLKM
jgi:ribosomal protein L32E